MNEQAQSIASSSRKGGFKTQLILVNYLEKTIRKVGRLGQTLRIFLIQVKLMYEYPSRSIINRSSYNASSPEYVTPSVLELLT
jgi:hypothetical protein